MKNKDIRGKLILLNNKIEKLENKAIIKISRGYKRDLVNLKEMIEKLYNEYEVDGVFDYNKFKRRGDDRMVNLFTSSLMTARYLSLQQELFETMKKSIDTTVKVMSSIDNVPSITREIDVDRIINNNSNPNIANVKRAKATDNLTRVIQDGLRDGDTYTTMGKKLTSKVGGDLNRNITTVRTLSGKCLNSTKLEILEGINETIQVNKVWNNVLDERSRDAHIALDGVSIPVKDNFISPLGGVGPAPGLMNNPADDYNCRCWLSMEVVPTEVVTEGI